MTVKRFLVSFEIMLDSKDSHKDVFKFIATEERIKSDIESSLESEFTFSVENLEVQEKERNEEQ